MKCEYCENELPDAVSRCPFCGSPVAATASVCNMPVSTGNLQNAEPLRQTHRDRVLKTDEGIVWPPREPELNSPHKRWFFLLLGILLGIWGIQFLYVGRFILFAITIACFVISLISPDYAPIVGVSIIASLVASFVIRTDGKNRKMKWF